MSGNSSKEAETAAALAERRRAALAQRRAYEHYHKRDGINPNHIGSGDINERNARLAWYAAATVIGALGATYAAGVVEYLSNIGKTKVRSGGYFTLH
jgi:hypothetical protein